MNLYEVDCLRDGKKLHYVIRFKEDGTMVLLPTKYLKELEMKKRSTNTIRKTAISIACYQKYLVEKGVSVKEVSEFNYSKQYFHFGEFLDWLKQGKHYCDITKKTPKNSTCNALLAEIFRWYAFMENEGAVDSLKVLANRNISFLSKEGVGILASQRTYDGYLRREESVGRTITRESIEALLNACTNTRDRLLILLLSETGFRIGELLGVKFQDVDFDNKKIRVCFRPDNENYALAKNAEYRSALISNDTFDILQFYLAENRELFMERCEYLLINLSGKNTGKAMKIDTVYAMFRCLETKTGISATPHMLRHYFAKEMYRLTGDLLLVSHMLGHRSLKTTLRYINVEEDEICSAAEKYYENEKPLFNVDKLL